ncbi:OLC1v1020427C1 [Oldenlandia corymbosa var. corymbosa]|uniref:OLC1v1020427C1 n=1 Tax=Oldenlandia corymbosa var. corymbosa TaxID=529605 RepID=A0AAV1EGI9_OLDCO|nr:OLC1v1020427C1 [Oldenlandia corymbosa var. corymbosa]
MEKQANFNVLMLPWLGHGHISPYLELAKKLSTKNFTISKLSEEFKESIKLVELHLPSLPELPPNYHTTNGLPSHLMPTLKEAFNKSCPNFREILKDLKPDLLIYDLLQPWAPVAAWLYNIPAVEFISSSVTMASLVYHSLKSPQGKKFPFESSIFYRGYESAMEDKLFVHDKDSTSFLDCIDRSTKIVLVKGSEEIEGKYIDYISTMTGKRVVPVGHLVQEPSLMMMVRIVKFPKGENVSLENVLPKGFQNRVGDRGKFVTGWAPQTKILTHPNTCGIVSHCGWNSVLEAMKFGLPIIAMPMHLDQPVNARLIEELGVGIEVLRDSSGNLRRETIARVNYQVVGGIDGEQVKKNAKEMKKKIEMTEEEEFDDHVVEELVQLCLMKNNKIWQIASTIKYYAFSCFGFSQI